MKPFLRYSITAAALVAALLSVGCMRPYDVPEFVEVKANETAYAVPLEEGAAAGIKFDSEAYLESKKVALKRIQIPHRWQQTHRFDHEGEWMDTMRIITVDRTPVTREWAPGSSSKTALWLESADSIGFSTGFSVTAMVEETDASRFLYSYKATSLAEVLDKELRTRIQSIASIVAASYKMDDLRDKKTELITKIREDVVPFFKARGITITTIGQFGGFEYENQKIQDAIDETFVAQQEKVKNKARLDAQNDANKRIELAALADAEAARTKAKGEADGRLSVFQAEASGKLATFEAEAKGLRAVNAALAESNQNPAVIELKKIEVDRIRAERWKGEVPAWVMSGENMPGMFLQMDPPKTK